MQRLSQLIFVSFVLPIYDASCHFLPLLFLHQQGEKCLAKDCLYGTVTNCSQNSMEKR